MWVYNEDINKWEIKDGNLSKSSFDVYKQELSSTRFYAKCLSGAVYLPVNNLDDIYETTKYKEKKNWFIPISSSQYTETLIPTDDPTPIEISNSDLYYDKNLNDYNLTLKNKFTPTKLINDSIDNYYYVDISTIEQIDVNSSFLRGKIDGVRLLKGHRILVKDQKTKESLPITTNPDDYFVGNYVKLSEIGLTAEYEYYNSENGVYVFDGEFLVKEEIFDEYEKAFRYSIVTKLGTNVGKQFHLSRLLDGYYPNESEPKEFLEKKNWMIRNRLDYNNLLEINYYDSIKHGTQSIEFAGITYSIPERTISVGEFGVILDTQNEFGGISNVIRNKYKVNLFSVEETDLYYWTCGEKGTLLKIRKFDFKIDKIDLPDVITSLNCVDFLTSSIGVVVGDFNTILITNDGGKNWERINVSKFSDFNYNKVLYYNANKFFVVGDNGVFIEFDKTINGYKAYKRRLSKFTEKLEDEFLLVDDINDIISATVSWDLTLTGEVPESNYLFDSQNYFGSATISVPNIKFVDGGNGFAYSAPGRSGNILKLNLTDDTTTTFGSFPSGGSVLYAEGIYSPNVNKIYFFPNSASDILVIDPTTDSTSTISWAYSVIDPCITPDGVIYSNTSGNSEFYKFDTNTETGSVLTIGTTNGGGSCVYSENGHVYFIPNGGPSEFYKLEVSSDLIYRVPAPDLNYEINDAVITSDGIIYAVSRSADSVFRVDTSDDSSFSFDLVSSNPINIEDMFILPDDTIYGISDTQQTVSKIDTDVLNITDVINLTTSGYYLKSDIIGNSAYSIGLNINDPILKLNFKEDLELPNILNEFLFVTTNNNNIIVYDINEIFNDFKFIYLEFNKEDYGDITNIVKRENSDDFYFTSDEGLYRFDFSYFPTMNTSEGIYNIATSSVGASPIDNRYYNDIFDYVGNELILSGNESLLLSHTYSSTFNDIIDSGFSDRNKSRMMFMNYDISSKLNFFRDNGEYRLPENISFTASSYIEFNQPIISGVTQSNWIDYWADAIQTFEYNTSLGLDESKKVLFSNRFDNINILSITNIFDIDSSDITDTLVDILPLAPEIEEISTNKFYGTASITTPIISKDLFLYRYLMVQRVPIGYNGYIDVGDVIRLTSEHIETNLIINKIYINGSYMYLYMYTGFNNNIIKNIKENGCVLENLNKYNSNIIVDGKDQLYYKFQRHPLSIAYTLDNVGTQSYTLSTKFNDKTAYYNLATKIDTLHNSYEMYYSDPFIQFGYSPIYNIYDYLRNIDSSLFYSDKEYLAMPVYKNIPLGSLTQSVAYIDTGISNNNKLLFGTDLKFEWESVFIDTFVDVNIYGSATYSTEKLLVMDKYYDKTNDAYVIEFHKKIEFDGLDAGILNGNGSLDIISRRKLSEISDDLRVLNNIHRSRKSKEITIGSEYFVYDNELNFKIKTNSYTNILLSDQVTKDNLSAIIYTDDNNELSMNILNLEEDLDLEANAVVEYNGKVSIVFKEMHNLNDGSLILISYSGEGVVTADNGCYPSDSSYDPNFFGSHVIEILAPNVVLLDIPWDPKYILNQFVVSFIKTDSFLNYTPIDLIDIGVDKKGRVSIELLPENSQFKDNTYSLVNVDFNKFRFRLFDGLTIHELSIKYPWLLEAEVSNAAIGLVDGELTWYSGIWECGRWFEGNWISGTWLSGDFYGGSWTSKQVTDKKIEFEISDKKIINTKSIWHNGRWFDGSWEGGIWRTGRWYAGEFNSGEWLDGIWNDGTFNGGNWKGGIWVLGNWNNGNFNTKNKPSYWLDGNFNGGDFGNGVWYNGTFEAKNNPARFGTESFNSRPSIWHGGDFLSGSFHSFLNLDSNNNPVRSKVNKYSIWYTGNFVTGDFYGGVVYNTKFNGTWHGGILEDIQVTNIEDIIDTISSNIIGKKLTLNGTFRFNIGDEITIMDMENDLNLFKTKVFLVDNENGVTYISTTPDVSLPTTLSPFPLSRYKVVSTFNNTNWKSGIWTNGVFNSGLWEGGMFYDGIFNGISI